ncbi:MAG: hypothetical protein M3063_08845, partial [Actinomycetota bacterium]|nr:hypothetical protein [Actinomycetota bacterium]
MSSNWTPGSEPRPKDGQEADPHDIEGAQPSPAWSPPQDHPSEDPRAVPPWLPRAGDQEPP